MTLTGPNSQGHPDTFLDFASMRLAHVLQKRIDDEMLLNTGLTAQQYSVLSYIRSEPSIGSAALARKLSITPQSAGTLLAGIDRSGYVARDRKVKPGTRVGVTLTPDGEKVLKRTDLLASKLRAEDEAGLAPGEADAVNQCCLVC